MVDEPEPEDETDLRKFVHERYRRTDAKLDQVINLLVDLRTRMGRLELTVGQIHPTLAEHSVRMDRIETRLERIEKRLDLFDPAIPD